jgi:hypothetical protein
VNIEGVTDVNIFIVLNIIITVHFTLLEQFVSFNWQYCIF